MSITNTSQMSTDFLPQGIGIGDAALVEQQVDELAGVHARVRVGVRDHGRDQRHHQHLRHRVLAQLRVLAVAAPVDIRLYEYCRYATLANHSESSINTVYIKTNISKFSDIQNIAC